MSLEQRKKFTVITNTDLENSSDKNIQTYSSGQKEKEKEKNANHGYHTNPMYEKLLQFELEQKRKKFTVDDLLKW